MMILKTSRSNLSSNDQLSLDLPFAATKSLTARVGPTPTFTRGSGATYIGSDGLIHGVDTSTTSNTIGTGSRTFTLAATAGQDQFWRTGDAVEASNGSNFMTGTVTSYDAATQSLVCNMTSTGGSGTFTSWRIGYRGPRFDHTSAGVCRGLLIEESRTNLILQSENHPSASWNKTGLTIASASNTAPNGDVNSNLVSEDSSTGLHRIFQSNAYVSGTSYSISCFFKYAGRQFVAITHPAVTSNGAVIFDIQNGTITLTQSGVTSSITAYPNGWYRCVVNGVSSTTSGQSHVIQGSTTGGILTGSYSGLNGPAFYIYGSQVEAGSFATSYIPTTTGSVVRSADVCSITGANFTSFYNQSEGTLFADVSGLMTDLLSGNRGFAVIADGTYNNTIGIYKSSGAAFIKAEGRTGNVSQFVLSNSYAPFTQYKLALGVKTNDTNAAFNGSLKTPITLVTMPSTMNRLELRDATGAPGGQPSCHLAAIRYYKKRLPDAKLVTLTT
jgi:hypothetical protein